MSFRSNEIVRFLMTLRIVQKEKSEFFFSEKKKKTTVTRFRTFTTNFLHNINFKHFSIFSNFVTHERLKRSSSWKISKLRKRAENKNKKIKKQKTWWKKKKKSRKKGNKTKIIVFGCWRQVKNYNYGDIFLYNENTSNAPRISYLCGINFHPVGKEKKDFF